MQRDDAPRCTHACMEGGSRTPYTVTFVKAWLSPYTGNVRDGRHLYRVRLKSQECRFLSRLLPACSNGVQEAKYAHPGRTFSGSVSNTTDPI